MGIAVPALMSFLARYVATASAGFPNLGGRVVAR